MISYAGAMIKMLPILLIVGGLFTFGYLGMVKRHPKIVPIMEKVGIKMPDMVGDAKAVSSALEEKSKAEHELLDAIHEGSQ